MTSMQGISRRLQGVVRGASLRLLMIGRPRHSVLAVEVVDLLSTKQQGRLDAVRDALDLVELHRPEFLAAFRTAVRRIVLLETGPQFWPTQRTVVLADPASLDTTRLAMVIVHEGTHALQHLKGKRFNSKTLGELEAECVQEEIELASRIPGAGGHVEWAKQKLAQPWWTAEKRLERALGDLDELRAPKVLIRLLKWRARRAGIG